jgi:cyanophycinase
MVLVGGALKNPTIYRKIIELAGGNQGLIGIITAASQPVSWDRFKNSPEASDSQANAEYYIQNFKTYGGNAVWIPVDIDSRENNSNPEIIALVNKMTGFFFGGGGSHSSTLNSRSNVLTLFAI